ncbi:hypothetical protein AgCh_019950 [Apium graveolens]
MLEKFNTSKSKSNADSVEDNIENIPPAPSNVESFLEEVTVNSSTDIRSPLKSNENIKKNTITTANMKTHFTETLKSSTANSSNKDYSTIRDTEIPDADCYSDDENDDNVQWEYDANNTTRNRVTLEYASLGPSSVKCSKCEAWMRKEERVNKYCSKGIPEFSLCRGKGEIQLPKEKSTPSYMWQLFNDKRALCLERI